MKLKNRNKIEIVTNSSSLSDFDVFSLRNDILETLKVLIVKVWFLK